MTDQNLDLKLE